MSKTAAIIAQSAESNEKRRYLLDRYHQTPNDKEAAAIREILENQQKPRTPEKVFHWKTVMVGALIGVALTAGFLWLGMPALGFELGHVAAGLAEYGISTGVAAAMTVALGGAAGAMIGLDREYVRRWLDKSEGIVNDPSRLERELAEREREVQTLSQATKREDTIRPMLRSQADAGAEKINLAEPAMLSATPPTQDLAARETPVSPRIIAGLPDAPATTISDVTAKDRVVNPQLAAAL